MADLKNFTDEQIIKHLQKRWPVMDSESRFGVRELLYGEEPELLVDEMKRELFEEAAQKYTLEQLHELLKI